MNPRRLQRETIFSINSPAFASAIGTGVWAFLRLWSSATRTVTFRTEFDSFPASRTLYGTNDMPAEQTVEPNQRKQVATATPPPTELAITGMTCGNCARHVTEALQSTPGVRSATVSLEAQQARVAW